MKLNCCVFFSHARFANGQAFQKPSAYAETVGKQQQIEAHKCVCVCEYAKGDCATMQEEGVKPVCELPNSNDMDKKFKSAKRAVEHHTGRTSSKAVDTQPSPAKSLPERSPSQSGRPIHVQSLLGQSKAT